MVTTKAVAHFAPCLYSETNHENNQHGVSDFYTLVYSTQSGNKVLTTKQAP